MVSVNVLPAVTVVVIGVPEFKAMPSPGRAVIVIVPVAAAAEYPPLFYTFRFIAVAIDAASIVASVSATVCV